MELIIFFLKTWSILWTILSVSMVIIFFMNRPTNTKFSLDLKTCFELTLYITSIYSWFL